MKKTIALICLAAIAVHAQAQSSRAKLDSLMDYYSVNYHFNGTAFIAIHDSVLLSKGFGFRNIAKKEENDANTIYQMGSNTKQFTAEIILQLAMNRQLGLDDKLTKFFPGYPDGDKITIHNLLTHTSGIFNYTDDSTWMDHATEHISREKLIALFKSQPLGFEPGSKWEYSNSNYVLLGCIIEQLTHKSYEEVVRERILVPCGMTHSGFDFADLKDKKKATGYNLINGDTYEEAPITDSSLSFAAGALYSTTGDMYKWHKALESYKLLPKEWQEKAFIPFKKKYAYGWFIDTLYNRRLTGHSGGIPGFYTYEMRFEQEDADIVLLQNNMKPDMDNNTIAVNIAKCLFDKDFKIPAPPDFVKVSPETLQKYAGDYALSPDFIINIKVSGDDLIAQATGQGAFTIKAKSDTLFTCQVVHADIEFVKDADGSVNKLILHQNGQHMPAARVTGKEKVASSQPAAIKVSTEVMQQYEGDYALTPDFVINIKLKGNDLYAQATGQPAFIISPESETLFTSQAVGAGIEFVKDQNEKVTKLILHQGGQDIPGLRK